MWIDSYNGIQHFISKSRYLYCSVYTKIADKWTTKHSIMIILCREPETVLCRNSRIFPFLQLDPYWIMNASILSQVLRVNSHCTVETLETHDG